MPSETSTRQVPLGVHHTQRASYSKKLVSRQNSQTLPSESVSVYNSSRTGRKSLLSYPYVFLLYPMGCSKLRDWDWNVTFLGRTTVVSTLLTRTMKSSFLVSVAAVRRRVIFLVYDSRLWRYLVLVFSHCGRRRRCVYSPYVFLLSVRQLRLPILVSHSVVSQISFAIHTLLTPFYLSHHTLDWSRRYHSKP